MSARSTVDSSAPPPAPAARAAQVRQSRETIPQSLRDAWRHRSLVPALGASVLNATVYRTMLGPAWIPIQVGVETIGPALIFGALLNLPSEDGIPYFLFLVVAMMAWRVFQRSLTFTMRSFHRYARLIRELSLPLPLVPVASTAQGVWEFLCYVVFVSGTLAFYGFRDGVNYLQLGPELVLAPIGIVWALLLAIGIGFFTAPIFMRARDVRFVLRLILPFWMYVTPVIYPLSEIGGGPARVVALLNPMASVVELVKRGILGGGVLVPWAIAWSLAVTLVLLFAGLHFVNTRGARLIGISGDDLDDDEDPL
jgi:lipopolysaccharide transport system permease protein